MTCARAWAQEFDQLIGEIQPFEGAHELWSSPEVPVNGWPV
jgi:hypothetical protein